MDAGNNRKAADIGVKLNTHFHPVPEWWS
jgi:hypothetical protein